MIGKNQIQDYIQMKMQVPFPCYCVGKKNGEPYCKCEMESRGVYQRNGMWIEPPKGEIVHGAVLEDFGSTT